MQTTMNQEIISASSQSRRILAIPTKKTDLPLVHHLSMAEMHAILDAPNVRTRAGLRDRAMIHLCFAAGLRVSELLRLPLTALTFHPTPTVHIQGKGRRERALPLWKQTADDLRAWLAVRGTLTVPEVFLSAHGRAMTRMGFTHMLHKYRGLAATSCPSLKAKHLTPHVLRHYLPFLTMSCTISKVWIFHHIR